MMTQERPATTPPRDTVFEALIASVQIAAAYNRDDVVPAAAILWTDERREWESLVPRLRVVMPQLLMLGAYNQANRVGPAIWLRCVLAGRVPDVTIPPDLVPIIYLPGVSRPTLRATEDCPPELRPLAELQYRGVFWSQYNGKDWTIAAFLQSDRGGLGLDVARARATATSIRRALGKLLDVPVVDLRAKAVHGPLESEDFDALISDDPVDDLLIWLSDPKGTRERWETSQWDTLCSRCKSDYGFDPVKDGELVGAERLGSRSKPAWQTAWRRFAAMPSRYAGLVDLLRKAKPASPSGDLLASLPSEAWPQDNEAEEAELRQALHEIAALPLAQARAQLCDLELKHGMRRSWVWAKLGRAPLAQAIQHLRRLAEVTKTALSGASTADLIEVYTRHGWRADAAVLDGLATLTSHEDRTAICAAIQHVYTPWLRDAAELFQQRLAARPLPGRDCPRLGDVPTGTCVLFVDGLRYDIGQKLQEALQGHVGGIELSHHTAALPTVTATAKPAVSPVAHQITGLTAGEDFCPSLIDGGKDLTIERFRALLNDAGFQVLSAAELGDPEGKSVRWVGLRCRVHINGQAAGCFVDLRDKVNAPDTSLTGARPVSQDGAVAFVVEDDAREGTAAILVLIDSGGTVVDQRAVTVGA